MLAWSKMSKELLRFGEKRPKNWKQVRQRQEVRLENVDRRDIAKWPTDEKSKRKEEAQTKLDINEIQLKAQLKNLSLKEEQMKKLDQEKDEALRIYKSASQKSHAGECLASCDSTANADRAILEWKALGFTITSEVSNTALSTVNGAIEIAKAAPSVVSDIARAVGNFGTFGSAPIEAPPRSESGSGQTEVAEPVAFPNASDPAYDKAYEIDELTTRLSETITTSLAKGIEQSTQKEFLECLTDTKNCKLSLDTEKPQTRPSQTACKILGECEKVYLIPCFNIARPHAYRLSRIY